MKNTTTVLSILLFVSSLVNGYQYRDSQKEKASLNVSLYRSATNEGCSDNAIDAHGNRVWLKDLGETAMVFQAGARFDISCFQFDVIDSGRTAESFAEAQAKNLGSAVSDKFTDEDISNFANDYISKHFSVDGVESVSAGVAVKRTDYGALANASTPEHNCEVLVREWNSKLEVLSSDCDGYE